MMTICLRFQCKIQSDLRIHSIQPIQSPHRLHLRYANEAAGTLAEKELYFRRAEMSLLQIRQQALHILRFLQPEMAWNDVANFSAKLNLLRDRLDKWHKALPANLHFSLPVEPNGDCVQSQEEARPKFLEYHFVEVNELILRPWLYICLHKKSRSVVDIQSASDIEQAMQAHFAVKATELASQHRKTVLLRLHVESRDPFLRGRESVSGGPWFKANNCLVLALLLIASHTEGSEISDSSLFMDIHWWEVVQSTLSILIVDSSSELNMRYIDLLQYILAQRNRNQLS